MPFDASPAPDKASTDLAYEVMNAVGQGLVVSSFSKNWCFEYVNPAFCQLVGRPAEDLAGMSMDDLIHPEDLQKLRRARERRITGETTSYEVRLVKPDGESVHVQITGAPRWRDGEFEGSIFVVTDLTDRIRSEQRIKASERRLADIISFLPDPTFVIDKEGRVTAWNRAMEELTAVKAEEMLGKGDYEYAILFYGTRRPILIDLVLSPNEEFENTYGTIQREGETLIAETYIPSFGPEGSYLWGKASPLYDAEGKLVGAIESIRDITDRRRAEEALQEREVHLRNLNRQIEQILGATKTGLDIIDAEFNILYIDPEWAKVYGDPKGRKCYEYFMGRTEVCPNCGIPKALETKEVTVTEEILVREGNRPIQVTTIPFQDSNGE